MNAKEKAMWMELLESLCHLDRHKVEVYARTLLELHGGLAFRVENSETEESKRNQPKERENL